jgi:hypothetical protein
MKKYNFYHIYKEKNTTMSVPYLPGRFTSKADFQRKKADQNKLLKLQIALNTEADKASLRKQAMMEGIRPAPIPEVEVSETLLDYNTQRQQAIENAKEVLKAKNATIFVDTYLKDLDMIVQFNRYWDDFQEGIKNIKLIDAPYMDKLWKKFMRQIEAATSGYASVGEFQAEIDQAARDILAMLEGNISDAEFASIETQVEDAARRFDLETLRTLRKKAVRQAAQAEARQRAQRKR